MNDAFTGDAAPTWLEAYDTAERSRNADGAPSIRANAAVAQTGSNGGGGTSTRAARDAREIPRIADGAVVRIVRCYAVGELMHVGLAEDDSSRLFQLNNNFGVVLRNEIFQNL